MEWILLIGFSVFASFVMRRTRDNAAEYAATGMARSPLYWTAAALTLSLLGLSLYMAHLQERGPIPWLYWPLVAVLLVVILLLRRALKWRYPI